MSTHPDWVKNAVAEIRRHLECDSEISAGAAAQYSFSDEKAQEIVRRHAAAAESGSAVPVLKAMLKHMATVEGADTYDHGLYERAEESLQWLTGSRSYK